MPLGAFKAALMGTAGVSTVESAVVLLPDEDYSGASEAVINSGISTTYGEYIFKFYNINPSTDGAFFHFQANATDSTSYDESIVSTCFYANHAEDNSGTPGFAYLTDHDQVGTAFQNIMTGIGSAANESTAGELHLFDPASTTYAKHFYTCMNMTQGPAVKTSNMFFAGYINTATAIDDIKFKMSAGNFDGTIKMWGVK